MIIITLGVHQILTLPRKKILGIRGSRLFSGPKIVYLLNDIKLSPARTHFMTAIVVSIFFGLTWHQIFGGAWLSYSFYAALYLPLILLFLGSYLSNFKTFHIGISLILGIAFFRYIGVPELHEFFKTQSNLNILSILLLSLCVLMIFLGKFTGIVSAILLATLMYLAPFTQAWSSFSLNSQTEIAGEYQDYRDGWNSRHQEDVQLISRDFAKYVRSSFETGESFWLVYPSSTPWLTSVASTQLYGYTCFHCADANPLIKNQHDLISIGQYRDEIKLRPNVIFLTTKKITEIELLTISGGIKMKLSDFQKIQAKNTKLYIYKFAI
jgi:hypothetical protein